VTLLRLLLALTIAACSAQDIDTGLFSALRWRLIGPFRAGRVTAVAGIPGDPNTFYFCTPGGGIWKTTDAGQVWQPIFDAQRVASIGALTVAPSDPKTIYAGTGEQTPGNGIYKSTDSGATWTNIGLRDARFMQAIVVDPRNPNIAVVGANSLGFGILWRPIPKYAYTAERGIFKTTDGGRTWKKVFSKDDTIGVVDLCSDPSNPRTLYASFFRPGSGFGDAEKKATSEIFRSTDGGSTWKPLASKGLPEKDRGRVGIAVAPGNHGRRLYAILDDGFYRSDDSGASWRHSTKDPRVAGSEYFSRIFVDPRNADVLYVAQTSLYRSADGGHTFEPYVGAPSGDDFHVLWIDPSNSARMILGVDQGAIISVDAGRTWSNWYNQPTGQFYHVATDHVFPYRAYAAQQDSGTMAVASRSDYGEISAPDSYSIGGFEYCYIAADPLNPNVIYSGGWFGSVVRFDKNTGQVATVFERGIKYRTTNMAPLFFSPHDPHTLYLGTQFVLKTGNGGQTWQAISPDLTGYVEKDENAPADPDQPAPPAISAMSPSPLQAGIIWAGTTNRIVQLTRDGGATWRNVSPTGLDEPLRILTVDASHHDPGTAYLAVGAMRESTPPYVVRTRDYGVTWQRIVNGLPETEMVRVVREDPVRKGLLHAGTDTGVYVSFDDGDHWKSLQLNLPATPVTDLDLHENDLVASTFGRAIWILDDLTPLRETTPQIASSEAYLFEPATAVRVRWDNFQDTPLPIETPAGKNPPDGAILDYFLKAAPTNEIAMTIFDEQGNEVRRFSSRAEPLDLPLPNVPSYWFGPPVALPKSAGVNRFAWDLRYPPPLSLPFSYFGGLLEYTEYTLADHAIPFDTPRQQPQGALVVPGKYTVELSVAGRKLRQALTVKLDPRVHSSESDLREQLDLAQQIARGMAVSYQAFKQVAELRKALEERKKAQPSLKDAAAALTKKIDAADNGTHKAPGFGPANRDLTRIFSGVESGDARPSDTARSAVEDICKSLDADLVKWRQLNEQDLVGFNQTLEGQKLSPLPVVRVEPSSGCGK
jgi:photosystem II stability/assembly factor-like uncharacterized protein